MTLIAIEHLDETGFFQPPADHAPAASTPNNSDNSSSDNSSSDNRDSDDVALAGQAQETRSWLSQCALLRITGPDSERFLQGQLTCDVVSLDPAEWRLGACCNAKGRMVANFVIARDQEGYWLRLPASQVSSLMMHLQKYAVFFKTNLQDLSDSYKVIGAWGGPQIDEQRCEWLPLGACLSHSDGRREFWLSNDSAEQALQDFSLIGSQQWAAADIEQGLVWVDEHSREHWVPQNIDWHRHGGVSFSKGCYTGQEIVARLQYLGKAKKALFALQYNGSQAVHPAPLSAVCQDDGKTIGELAAWNHAAGLALLNDNFANAEACLNDDENGEFSVTVRKLTYTDEQETSSGS
jgi:folate-binding protein YgfZ